jgi:hypothetical protein
MASPHPDLAPLVFLLGTWRGGGSGDYPTIDPFRYGEEMTFEHVGDPFLLYTQASWLDDDETPLHFERGFLRPGVEPGGVELVLAHPLGLTEVAHGGVEGTALELSSEGAVARTHTGAAVTGLTRRYEVEGDRMRYRVAMAMDATPMSWHLTGELTRASR